jgi:diaminopimelate epimerase
MGSLAFDKYEGLGNDFVVVDAASDAEWTGERVRALCDRRFGVGGDGVLLVLPPVAGGDARMRVVNADGSTPEMCGNGIRCVALHLARARDVKSGELAIESDAGVRRCAFEREGAAATVTVDMGVVTVGADVAIDVDGVRVELTKADAGNPHAVTMKAVQREEFERLGAQLTRHPAFPHGANIEFVRFDAGVLHVVVWERGVGPTLACGTGACAAVAVACRAGVVPAGSYVRVRLPGGDLDVRYEAENGRTTMRGPARHVFAGTVPRGA